MFIYIIYYTSLSSCQRFIVFFKIINSVLFISVVTSSVYAVEPVSEKANKILCESIAKELESVLNQNPSMSQDEKKKFVEERFNDLDHNQRGKEFMAMFAQESKDSIRQNTDSKECLQKAENVEDAKMCFKPIMASYSEAMQKLFNEKLVWTDQTKKSHLFALDSSTRIHNRILDCFENEETLTKALKCTQDNRLPPGYVARISAILMIAQNNILMKKANGVFSEKCKMAKSTIFERPLKNEGVFFDTVYALNESYMNIDLLGNYVKTYRQINIDENKLFDLVGFIEKNSDKYHKEYLYYDRQNPSGIQSSEQKSRYILKINRLKDDEKESYGVHGSSMELVDQKTGKVIANTIYYDNGYNKMICGETYNGYFDAEYFVHHVFSY